MKTISFSVLVGILIYGNLLALVPQDPPMPDVVAFCTMNHKDQEAVCTCANMDLGGVACTKNDNDRPRFCQWKCGHAKSCGCCVS